MRSGIVYWNGPHGCSLQMQFQYFAVSLSWRCKAPSQRFKPVLSWGPHQGNVGATFSQQIYNVVPTLCQRSYNVGAALRPRFYGVGATRYTNEVYHINFVTISISSL